MFKWNFMTIIIIILMISFLIYLYTSKLPVEEYMNQYGHLYGEDPTIEGFDDDDSDIEEPFDNDNDNDDIENLTFVDDYYSTSCYGMGERQCVNTPGCEWTISDGYGQCQNRTNWYNPFYNGWYNWYNRYWSPWRWSYPYYSSYYSYPSYYYSYPRWWRRRGRRWRRHGGRKWGGRRVGRRMSGGRRSGRIRRTGRTGRSGRRSSGRRR